jgi:Tol biopolymer transport system component
MTSLLVKIFLPILWLSSLAFPSPIHQAQLLHAHIQASEDEKILFSATEGDGYYDIYVMNPDGTELRKIEINSLWIIRLSVSPDGKTIVYDATFSKNYRWDETHLYTMDINGKNKKQITNATSSGFDPDWLGGNKKIVYSSSQTGNSEIYIMDIENKAKKKLTWSNDYDYSPKSSPNGKQIIFETHEEQYFFESGFFLMNADGTGKEKLSNPSMDDCYTADWSPDGRKILFGCEGEIIILDLNDKTTSRKPYKGMYPTFSPKGDQILYLGGRNYKDFLIMDLKNWESQQIEVEKKFEEIYSLNWIRVSETA